MPYENLQEFLRALDAAGELRRIKASVDPLLEVAEITDRVSKSPDRAGFYPGSTVTYASAKNSHPGAINQALLFEKIEGSSMPLSINTFGSYKRMQMALGCDSFDELAEKIAELTRPE